VIVRSARPSSHFTVLSNQVIRDRRLSWRARGILVYLLSQPDNWRTTSAHLASTGQEGRDSVRNALQELETVGYLVRQKHQDGRGRWTTAVYVFDDPQNPQGFPQPKPENQASVDQALLEETNTKDLGDNIRPKFSRMEPQVCGNCDGAGWTPSGKGLDRCSCRGGIQ